MTNTQLKDMLAAQRVLPLDGAWGTELARRGLAAGDVPETWNMTHADDVAAVPRAYIEAGARVVLTNTFGGTRFRLMRHGFAGRVREFNQAGAALCREAADGHQGRDFIRVAGHVPVVPRGQGHLSGVPRLVRCQAPR